MKSLCRSALLVLALLPALPAQQPFVLNDGTPLRVRLNRTVSSADAKVGETVDFDVLEDVLVNGAVAIQRGSKVLATVTEAQAKGLLGKSGKLHVGLDHARSVLGEKIPLRAIEKSDRGGGGLTDVAASIVTAPLLVFMRGKDITLPKGTEVTAYVHGEIRLDEARVRAHAAGSPAAPAASPPAAASAERPPAGSVPQPAPAQAGGAPPQPVPAADAAPSQPAAPAPAPRASAPPSGMTNADVIALKTVGFSDDLIVSKIKSSKCAFRLETNDLIELKKAGLSDRVIGAMMDKAQ